MTDVDKIKIYDDLIKEIKDKTGVWSNYIDFDDVEDVKTIINEFIYCNCAYCRFFDKLFCKKHKKFIEDTKYMWKCEDFYPAVE